MPKPRMMRTPEEIFCGICNEKRGINPETLKHTVILAVEIAREGREGRKIGTMFVVGDSPEVLQHSRSLILDPLFGHPDESKLIHLADMRETVKELAQLDGAFVVSDEGVVVSACRYIDAFSEGIKLPLGLGSRHVAAASISPSRPKPWRLSFPRAPSYVSSMTAKSSPRLFRSSGCLLATGHIWRGRSRRLRRKT